MAIENIPGGGTMITGKDDIRFFALLQLAHGIALEMNTNLRMSSRISTLQAARNMGLVPEGRRPQKKALLRLVVQAIRETKPDYEPSGSVAKALAQ